MSGINLPFLLRCVMLLWKGCLSVEMTQSLATGFPWKTLGTTWLSFESTFLQTDNSMWVCLNSHPQPYHSPKAIPNVCSCDNKRTDTQSCVEILADILAKIFRWILNILYQNNKYFLPGLVNNVCSSQVFLSLKKNRSSVLASGCNISAHIRHTKSSFLFPSVLISR